MQMDRLNANIDLDSYYLLGFRHNSVNISILENIAELRFSFSIFVGL